MSLRRVAFARRPPPPSLARVRQWSGPHPTPREPARAVCVPSRAIVTLPKENPLRSETYRRTVAALPCVYCGIQGRSQAAHPNVGKAKGLKADDRLCFPLCAPSMGVAGCHQLFDLHLLVPLKHRKGAEESWGAQTRAAVSNAGKWPKRLPKWQ